MIVAKAILIALTVATGALWGQPHDARAATSFVVNKTADTSDRNLADNKCDVSARSGKQCTLRAAIEQANATPGADVINFKITTTSKVIRPTSALPFITDEVVINGYSQPGASENTLPTMDNAVLKVTLDGVNAGLGANGLDILADHSTVKGLAIGRFSASGVRINGNNNTVRGNFVGTNARGVVAKPNAYGVVVLGDENVIGSAPGDYAGRNLISGNAVAGIGIAGARNVIGTNIVGAGRDGSDRGNQVGILVAGSDNAVGLDSPDGLASNTISFNRIGILLEDRTGITVTGNVVTSNAISHNTESGVVIEAGPNEIVLNQIFLNGGDGITVGDGEGIRITRNQFLGNERLGINLVGGNEANDGRGVTPNDAGDADTGPNSLQNFPEMSSAIRGTGANPMTTLNGTLDSLPNRRYLIEFFAAGARPTDADPSGFGEGTFYLGFLIVQTDASGHANIRTLVRDIPAGLLVTATATDDVAMSTSEFSLNREVVDPL